MFGVERHIVFIDKWSASCGHEDAEGEGDEHESCYTGRIAFSFLKDYGESNEKHI